jgi:hypothetical protein
MQIDITNLFQCGTDDNKNDSFTAMKSELETEQNTEIIENIYDEQDNYPRTN